MHLKIQHDLNEIFTVTTFTTCPVFEITFVGSRKYEMCPFYVIEHRETIFKKENMVFVYVDLRQYIFRVKFN